MSLAIGRYLVPLHVIWVILLSLFTVIQRWKNSASEKESEAETYFLSLFTTGEGGLDKAEELNFLTEKIIKFKNWLLNKWEAEV